MDLPIQVTYLLQELRMLLVQQEISNLQHFLLLVKLVEKAFIVQILE